MTMTDYDKPQMTSIEHQASQILCASVTSGTTETFTEKSDYTIFE